MITTIILRPAGRGRFHAILDGAIICSSKTPLLSAARVLIEIGHDAGALLQARHEGSDIVAMRARLGVAAGLTVAERDDGKRQPHFAPHQAFQDAQELAHVRSLSMSA